jgi:hypothetical protein
MRIVTSFLTGTRRLVAAGVAVAAISAGVGALAVQPASALGATQCGRGGCDLFQFGPENGYFFSTPGWSAVGMICWKDSVWYDGTNRWFYVSTIYGTGRAWVSANQVVNQRIVGHC